MALIISHLLSFILFFPTLAALIVLFVSGTRVRFIRWWTFGASLVPLLLTVLLWLQFNPTTTGFQFEEKFPWYAALNSSYHLGVDGISLPMVLLTTLLAPLAILASFGITDQVKPYMILFLLLETGMLGVFMALDLVLFFVFWEIGLVPMYFLINRWGGTNRNYASLKFILFTIGGSLGLLLAIQVIGVVMGTYDLVELINQWPGMTRFEVFNLPASSVKAIAFWAFVVAFAIKVPAWPFHTWLPDAHTEAPTAGSMLLAGVLLKLGAYGFLRLVLPLFPIESKNFASPLTIMATLSIIFGAFSAYGQRDFKRLVAYSSISHMGFVVLGVAVAAFASGTDNAVIAVNGAVLQMFAHGLSSAGMFFLVGVIYERTHTRDLIEYGGLYALLPIYGGILLFTAMGSLGLPGLAGFVAEFLVVRGAWPVFMVATALSTLGLLFTGLYVLKALKQVLHGPANQRWVGHLSQMTPREIVVMAPLMVFILLTGIWPAWILNIINRAVITWF